MFVYIKKEKFRMDIHLSAKMFLVVLVVIQLLFAIENCLGNAIGKDDLLVTIASGQLRGSMMQSEGGRDFYSYRGIPYGEPPTRELRFKPPVPKKKWEGVLDAAHDGPLCPQFSVKLKFLIGDEDCLFVNVYSPLPPSQRKDGQLLPIIVFMHGGAFVMDSGVSSEIGAEKMMDYDVIIVTFNFRVNVLGFLSTGDEASPGNYALFDQVLLLKWVRDNIKAFGGDPNKVTISGTSAGGWAVMLHMVSPLSKGLFHAAISQSGTPFGNWGNVFDPKKTVDSLAAMMDCQGNNNQETVDCFRRRSAIEIVQKNFFLEDFCNLMCHVRHHPVKDSVRGAEAFLPDYPPVLLEKGTTINKVPLFLGVAKSDGCFIFDACAMKYNALGSDHLNNWLPTLLQEILGASEEKSYILRDAIVQEYFADDPQDEDEITQRLCRIYTDMTFDYSVDDITQKMASLDVPVYTYRFNHFKGGFDFYGTNLSFAYKQQDHISHVEDFTYVFNGHRSPEMDEWSKFNEQDKHVSKLLLDLWTSFARDQVPSSELMPFPWKPSTTAQPVYLNISVEPNMVDGQLSPHSDFWIKSMKELNAQYY